ncbi:hypothetical protein BAC7755_35240 [Bacillus sp. MN7755]
MFSSDVNNKLFYLFLKVNFSMKVYFRIVDFIGSISFSIKNKKILKKYTFKTLITKSLFP